MKNLKIIVLLLLFVQLACYAQEEYSLENLEKSSPEELEMYLDKANNLQKSGKIVTIVGGSILGATAITIGTMAIIDQGDWALAAAGVGILGGLAGVGTMSVGIPMNITGKKRVERIYAVKNSAFYEINVELSPCVQYNIATQDYQPGVLLKVRF